MIDRRFTEVDLRSMLERVQRMYPDHVEGRWLARATLGGRAWTVVLEPDGEVPCIVVVTAYPTELP